MVVKGDVWLVHPRSGQAALCDGEKRAAGAAIKSTTQFVARFAARVANLLVELQSKMCADRRSQQLSARVRKLAALPERRKPRSKMEDPQWLSDGGS